MAWQLCAEAPASEASDGAKPTVTRVGITQAGVLIGTAAYMSPEQASGRLVDYRSDQFALGVVIYELVTRTRPFERPTAPAVTRRHDRGRPNAD